MKFSVRYGVVLFVLGVVLLPVFALAQVKIELKNGRAISADSCEESGTVLRCYKMGGTFDIEKKDVARVSEGAEGEGTAEEGVSEEASSPEDMGKDMQKRGEGSSEKASAAGRIDEIRKRKLEIAPERDKLLKEREQLQEELKKAPDWMTGKQYDELQKRNEELAEKIKKYNEEVEGLNSEEKRIVDEGKKKD